MKEVLRTNNPVLLTRAETLLAGEDIGSVILDGHTSILEGSVGILPRRLMVVDDDHGRACRILRAHLPEEFDG